jgi:hypothetical protein
LEHSELAWCAPVNLLTYRLAPSDRAFATFFLSEVA